MVSHHGLVSGVPYLNTVKIAISEVARARELTLFVLFGKVF